MAQTVQVALGTRSYDIRIGAGVLGEVGTACRALGLGKRCLVVTDVNVDAAWGPSCVSSLEHAGFSVACAVVPAGEGSKSSEQLFGLYTRALAHGLDRTGFMVALGGGVVGDLAGYAAASYLRGIDLVQVPTSVVAMVDSAVGGKTGINLPEGKNLVGAFYQPRMVLADRAVLETLPEREYVSGLAEVVKYGIIRDRELFDRIESRLDAVLAKDEAALEDLLARSCNIKADVVSRDEREGGLRAVLNFGHTLGHAIENVAGYGRLLHGEAIAVGMVYAARLSVRELGLATGTCGRIRDLLARLGLPVRAPDLSWEDLRRAMGVDKKVRGGAPRFVLAKDIGDVAFGCDVSEQVLESTWKEME